MATLPPPKRNHSNAKQYGTGFSPSTMFGSAERADLMSIERPRRKRVSSIEMMMRALRLEEKQLDINSDESFDSSTTDNKQNAGNPRDIEHTSKTTRRFRSNEDPQITVRRRILVDTLTTAKTVRMNNYYKSKSRYEEQEDDGDSVHESIMTSMMATSTRTIKTTA